MTLSSQRFPWDRLGRVDHHGAQTEVLILSITPSLTRGDRLGPLAEMTEASHHTRTC